MNKEDILNKARDERERRQGEDEHSLAVIGRAGYIACYAGAFACIVFTLAQRIKTGGYFDPKPGAIFFCMWAVMFLYRGIRLKRTHETVAGGGFAALAVALTLVCFFHLMK
ncbi:MAG: hypothetical protein IKZ82_12210 [Clostridia bacterium]|nr:hypothetical protein [Clostridia bacterium]